MQIFLNRIFFTTALCTVGTMVFQIKCKAQANIPQAANKVSTVSGTPNKPGAYAGTAAVNMVRTWVPQQPYNTVKDLFTDDGSVSKVQHTTDYTDGLGRPLQTVNWQSSPHNTDLVTPFVYDGLGRQQYQYLPYNSTGNDGNFKTDPFTEQVNFFNASAGSYQTEQPSIQNEAFYYGHTDYELSPLNRVTAQFSPGNSWAGSEGTSSEKAKKTQYQVNITTDQVLQWDIAYASLSYTSADDGGVNVPTSGGTYSAGQLYKTVAKNEDGNVVVEYVDLQGHIVLTKVQYNSSIAPDYTGYTGFLCTYNVYDDAGALRFVITPKAVNQMIINGQWVLSNDIVNELCERYEYDGWHRLIAKREPGSGWTYMVYDQMDRLVFKQDANLRKNNQWSETLYDNESRVVETGILNYSGNLTGLQINYTATSTTVSGGYESSVLDNLYLTNRQIGVTAYTASKNIIFDNGFSSEDGATYTASISSANGQTFSNTVITSANPIPQNCAGCTFVALKTITYDGYSTTKSYVNETINVSASVYYDPLPASASLITRGMVTSTKTRVLENAADITQGGWLEKAIFYDDKGRIIQAQADNYKGGIDRETNLYSFTAQVLCKYEVHNNTSGNITNLGIKTNFSYDQAGRLLSITKQLSGNNLPASLLGSRTVAQYTYDALGRMKEKQEGQNSTGGILEDETYNYNIRGWMKGINWNYGASPTTANASLQNNKWFAMDLSYDWGFQNNRYCGNIAGERWMNAGDMAERAYGFGYDNADRLMSADFNQNFSSSWRKSDPNTGNSPLNIDFSVTMGSDGLNAASAYDFNGNIIQMQQMGMILNASQPVDQLSYNYIKVLNGAENGSGISTNKLAYVTDDNMSMNGSTGDFNDLKKSGDYYGYDKAGNLISDINKNMNGPVGLDQTGTGAIVYNFLGLAARQTIYNGSAVSQVISFVYDADGNKLEKQAINQSSGQQVIDSYLGDFVYENNVLQFSNFEEGRVRFTNNTTTPLVYDYFVEDNVKNVRAVLTEEKRVDPYPVATLEDASISNEQTYYNIPSRVLTNTVDPSYPTDNTSAYTQQLLAAGTTPALGTGIVLKVMAGDMITVSVNCWYKTPASTSPSPITSPALTGIISTLAASNGLPFASAGKLGASQLTTTALTPDVNNFINFRNTNSFNPAIPKAFLNIVVFDEQMRPVLTTDGNNSYFVQVPTENNFIKSGSSNTNPNNKTYPIIVPNKLITKSGYVYIYVSNEDQNIKTYFDNMQVIHTRGPLLETNDYYPAGLKMAGICSKEATVMANKHQYQGAYSEFQNETSYNQFTLRNYDPQIGRWVSADPDGQFASPYVGMGNNWPNGSDPKGSDFNILGDIAGGLINVWSNKDNIKNFWQGLGYFGAGAIGSELGYETGAKGDMGVYSGFLAFGAGGSLNMLVDAIAHPHDHLQASQYVGSFILGGLSAVQGQDAGKDIAGANGSDKFDYGDKKGPLSWLNGTMSPTRKVGDKAKTDFWGTSGSPNMEQAIMNTLQLAGSNLRSKSPGYVLDYFVAFASGYAASLLSNKYLPQNVGANKYGSDQINPGQIFWRNSLQGVIGQVFNNIRSAYDNSSNFRNTPNDIMQGIIPINFKSRNADDQGDWGNLIGNAGFLIYYLGAASER